MRSRRYCCDVQYSREQTRLRPGRFFSSVRPHLRGVVAIHDIVGLCAVGGTRCATHSTVQDAMDDALRLSRAMSYKNAMADLPFGGGKAVLFGIGVSDRRELVECYAGWLNSLALLWNRIIRRWHSTPTCQFTSSAKTRIPAELVTCERICGSM